MLVFLLAFHAYGADVENLFLTLMKHRDSVSVEYKKLSDGSVKVLIKAIAQEGDMDLGRITVESVGTTQTDALAAAVLNFERKRQESIDSIEKKRRELSQPTYQWMAPRIKTVNPFLKDNKNEVSALLKQKMSVLHSDTIFTLKPQADTGWELKTLTPASPHLVVNGSSSSHTDGHGVIEAPMQTQEPQQKKVLASAPSPRTVTSAVPEKIAPEEITIDLGGNAPPIKSANWLNLPAGINARDLPRHLKGKVVMVEFFGTWCGPCKYGLPHLLELQKKYEKKGVQLIVIAHDKKMKVENFMNGEIKKFVGSGEMPGIVATDAPETIRQYFDRYKLEGYPSTVIVDTSGNAVWSGSPFDAEKELEKLVRRRR